MSSASGRRVIDLSHVIVEGMVTYPGIPGPTLGWHLTFDESAAHYAAGTEFAIGTISMAANTGTYLDTPAHRYRDGEDLSRLSLDKMVDRPGVVVRVRNRDTRDGRAIGEAQLRAALGDVDPVGMAVLVETGHSDRWGTPAYFAEHPYLTDDAVEFLISTKPSLVGIDSLNIDSTHTGRRPAHSWLLAARIPVVEHLTGLADLPDTGFRFTAAPPAVRGMGTFPVRAFAVVGG
ncbi:cyclase family protein [Nakamurella sp.]|uniref:cyclase family protein n=1 Tax=Nakamurella sp. TaxID=1869182 RepID=UPI0037850E32